MVKLLPQRFFLQATIISERTMSIHKSLFHGTTISSSTPVSLQFNNEQFIFLSALLQHNNNAVKEKIENGNSSNRELESSFWLLFAWKSVGVIAFYAHCKTVRRIKKMKKSSPPTFLKKWQERKGFKSFPMYLKLNITLYSKIFFFYHRIAFRNILRWLLFFPLLLLYAQKMK